jgi:solute carrier family 25 2-oxodicarboxylate transporter 21
VSSGAAGAGILAGITEAFVVVPFELVKIRLQDKANVSLHCHSFVSLIH